jgi:hypothetical protein
MRQRGVPNDVLMTAFAHADIERPGRAGVSCMRVSRAAIEDLRDQGIRPGLVERAIRLELLLSEDGSLCTVIKVDPKRRLRRPKNPGRRVGSRRTRG